MFNKRFTGSMAALAVGLTAVTTLTGCGGGTTALSSGTSPTLPNQTLDANGRSIASPGVNAPAGTTRRAGVFVTGGAPVGYAHAWITLHKIEVVDRAEKPASVWESRDGLAIDLATLRDGSGPLYALVTSAAIPAGQSHTRVRVTIDKSLLLYSPGATAAQTMQLSDTLPRDDEGRPVLTYSLAKARDLGSGKEDIVVAFDPTKIVLNGGRAKLVASDGTKAAHATLLADASRQIPALFTGTVEDTAAPTASASSAAPGAAPSPMASGAPAPEVKPKRSPKGGKAVAEAPQEPSFTLKDESGQTVVVQVSKNTPVVGDTGTAGTASPAPSPSADAKAAAAPAPAASGAPTSSPAPSAVAFAAPVASGKRVWVRGTLSEETKRIVATDVVVLPPVAMAAKSDEGDSSAASTDTAGSAAAVIGAASEVKPENASFTVAARQVYGLVPSQSAITVILGKGASVLDRSGRTLSNTDLYSALKGANTAVEASGAYDPITGTLTAAQVMLDAPTVGVTPASPAAAVSVTTASAAR